MFDNFSKFDVSGEDFAVRRMHVDPDRLLFMFAERILIPFKSDSFYLRSIKTQKMAANPLKKTEIRREMSEVPAAILPVLRLGAVISDKQLESLYFDDHPRFFACGALAASICVGIVIPSTWFVYLYNILLA